MFFVLEVPDIDVIYYSIIWTDNGSTLPKANTWKQEVKYPMIKVLLGCNSKLLLNRIHIYQTNGKRMHSFG